MSTYPGTLDTFNVIGTTNYMDEAGYVLHEHLNSHGSAIIQTQTTLGTNSGTSILKDFTAGEFAVARNAGGTLRDTITLGTINNAVLGTPSITGGTFNAGVFGTPAITGGTYTSPTIAGTPVLDADSAIPFYGDSMSRQAIINGNFDVWQRGVAGTNPTNTIFPAADRWFVNVINTAGTLPTSIVHSQQTLTAGDISNSYYYYQIALNGAGSGLGTGDFYALRSNLEHATRYLCGAGKQLTFSFYARSSIANKKIGVTYYQGYGTGGAPTTTETIVGTNWTLGTGWTQYAHTVTTNTLAGKTFGTSNNDHFDVNFCIAWGEPKGTFVGATAAETYVGSGNIDIAQVQLCAGDVALPFQPKSYAQELQDCLRYAWVPYGLSASRYPFITGFAYSASAAAIYANLPVTMRAIPTTLDVTSADWQLWNDADGAIDATGVSLGGACTPDMVQLAVAGTGLTTYRNYMLKPDASAPRTMVFGAEL